MNRNRSQNDTNDKLVDRNMKTTTLDILCMFKKIDESMNMLRRDTGNIKRQTLKDQHYVSIDGNAI